MNKIKMILNKILHRIRPNSSMVFFMSFYGLYNDNTKYISEKLHEKAPHIKIYWLIDYKRCKISEIPEYVKKVNIRGIKKLFIQNRAKVLVDNISGWNSLITSKNEYKEYIKIKNKKVFNLCTWHGTPIKKIGVDAYSYDDTRNYFFTTADLMIANSKYTQQIFNNCFQRRFPVILTGTPRNDILVNLTLEKRNKILNKFSLDKDYRYVIYAPTYRDVESGCEHQRNFDFMWGLDTEQLLLSLKNKFGGNWKLIFRGHQSDQKLDDFNIFISKMNGNVIDGNLFSDMAEYLAISDALITDYSGSIFDFCITNKPIFLYTPDLDIYRNSNRGVYDLNLPFKYNCTNKELIDTISHYEEKQYRQTVEDFKSEIELFEDGAASERITDIILEKLR